jgi:hypothetical protein
MEGEDDVWHIASRTSTTLSSSNVGSSTCRSTQTALAAQSQHRWTQSSITANSAVTLHSMFSTLYHLDTPAARRL